MPEAPPVIRMVLPLVFIVLLRVGEAEIGGILSD